MALTYSDFATELSGKLRALREEAHKKQMKAIGSFWHSEKVPKGQYEALGGAIDALHVVWQDFNRRADSQDGLIKQHVSAEVDAQFSQLRSDVANHLDATIADRVARIMQSAFPPHST